MLSIRSFGILSLVVLSWAKSELDITIDPNNVDSTTKSAWCSAQLNACGILCGNSVDVNRCTPTDLSWSCTCSSNHSTPGLQYYTNTMPTFICLESYSECIQQQSGNASGQEECTAIKDICASHELPKNPVLPESSASTTHTTSSVPANTQTSSSRSSSKSSTSSTRASSSASSSISPAKTSGTSAPSGGSSGLSTGAIVGIAVGVAIVAIIASVLTFWLCIRKRLNKKEATDTSSPANMDEKTNGRSELHNTSIQQPQMLHSENSRWNYHEAQGQSAVPQPQMLHSQSSTQGYYEVPGQSAMYQPQMLHSESSTQGYYEVQGHSQPQMLHSQGSTQGYNEVQGHSVHPMPNHDMNGYYQQYQHPSGGGPEQFSSAGGQSH